MNTRTLLLPTLLLGLPAIAVAADRENLSLDCEVAVALSAAPARLRDDASVFALVDGRYEQVVEGEGPLTCIVERNHKDSLVPQCLDRAGADTILPALLARSRMSLDGLSFEEASAKISKALDAGDYPAPERAGVSYMMSDYNYIYAPRAQKVLKIPPHVMFYAPNVSNADVGGSLEGVTTNIGTPFVVNEGPHGYMITYTQYPSNSADVAAACAGQLGEPPPDFDPFPKDPS